MRFGAGLACVAAAVASRSHEFRPAHPRGSMVVVTGTGRTGTTFLMTLLTYLGLPTGLDFAEWSRNRTSPYDPPNAGLEFDCEWATRTAACLAGMRRRGALVVKAPDGQKLQVIVPPGVMPGQQMAVLVPVAVIEAERA